MGTVISHVFPEGSLPIISRQVITYASKMLTASEKNYTQLEKEELALVFGVHKFHQTSAAEGLP